MKKNFLLKYGFRKNHIFQLNHHIHLMENDNKVYTVYIFDMSFEILVDLLRNSEYSQCDRDSKRLCEKGHT